MNFYKKINQYFLEHYPTLWNTHFVWMILIGICTHFLFFGFGYVALTISELKRYAISSLFFRQGYFGLYLIIGLISLIFFAFRYFAHNPFRNFYPISKSYFWKIFAQLSIILFVFATVFISFENGALLKTKSIAPIAIIEKESYKVNLAKPFLFNDIADYNIEKRSFPNPFPCEEISDYQTGYDSENDVAILHGIDYSKPYLTLNGNEYQFGKFKTIQIDSCNSETFLDTIYDVSKIDGIAEYSVLNYGGLSNYTEFENENISSVLPTIHQWYLNKNKSAIENALHDLKTICAKYNIGEELNPSKMANAILIQDINKQSLVSTGFYDFRDKNHMTYEGVEVAAAAVDESAPKRKIKQNSPYNYSVDIQTFSRIVENVATIHEDMGYHQFTKETVWFLIFVSLCFALILIVLKHIEVVDILIGIVVTSILGAILGLIIFVFLENFGHSRNNDIYSSAIALLFGISIVAIAWWGLQTHKIKKSILSKSMIAVYTSILAIPPTLYFTIREATRFEKKMPCEYSTTTHYWFEPHPFHFLLLGLLSIGIIFYLIKKVHSSAD